MYYEPDTVWGRTLEGDEEIATPRTGLSLVQRRMLADLAQPRTFASLVTRYQADAPKLEHELIRLAQARLVAFQRPGSDTPRTAPQLAPSTAVHPPRAAWTPGVGSYAIAIALGFVAVMLIFA